MRWIGVNTSTDPSSHESAPIRFLVNYMNIVATAVSVCTCVNDTVTAVFHSTVCLLCSLGMHSVSTGP